jgi:hypothetical protein
MLTLISKNEYEGGAGLTQDNFHGIYSCLVKSFGMVEANITPKSKMVINPRVLEDKSIGRLLILRYNVWNRSTFVICNGKTPLWVFVKKEKRDESRHH